MKEKITGKNSLKLKNLGILLNSCTDIDEDEDEDCKDEIYNS